MSESASAWLGACKRIVLISGLCGMLIGLFISTWNADEFGWSLLRVAGLGLVFALGARWTTNLLMRAWLESKIQQAERDALQQAGAKAKN